MSTQTEKEVVDQILGQEFTQNIIAELEIQGQSPEIQAEIISMIGANISRRIIWAILELLPQKEQVVFTELVDSGNWPVLETFLRTYIPNPQEFAQHEAMLEFESTKTRARMILEGVDTEGE